jgi:hypothetical protein
MRTIRTGGDRDTVEGSSRQEAKFKKKASASRRRGGGEGTRKKRNEDRCTDNLIGLTA